MFVRYSRTNIAQSSGYVSRRPKCPVSASGDRRPATSVAAETAPRVLPYRLADADFRAVRVERHVTRDLGDRVVGLLVGPDQVGLGPSVRGLDTVVAGVTLVRAVGLAVGSDQQ